MKRIVLFAFAAFVMGLGTAWAQDVSLGDYARQQRAKEKPASPTTKVFTNDDISASPAATAPAPDTSSDKDKDKDAKAKEKDKTAAEKADKAAADFKERVAKQKEKIAEIKRNMDVSEREFKLHSIEWYTQAGNALLDPKKYKDETDKHNAEMADLQKQLDAANADMDKIREEIRQAGLSSSIGD